MAMLTLTKTVLKSLFGKPATRQYPFEKREPFANTRGHVVVNITSCMFCTLCEKKCPTGAIKIDRKAKLFEINRLKCITCAACVEGCNQKSLQIAGSYTTPTSTGAIDRYQIETPLNEECTPENCPS